MKLAAIPKRAPCRGRTPREMLMKRVSGPKHVQESLPESTTFDEDHRFVKAALVLTDGPFPLSQKIL